MGQPQLLWTSCASRPGGHHGWLKLQGMNPTYRTSLLKITFKKLNLSVSSKWVFLALFSIQLFSLFSIPAEDLTWNIEGNHLQHQKRSAYLIRSIIHYL